MANQKQAFKIDPPYNWTTLSVNQQRLADLLQPTSC